MCGDLGTSLLKEGGQRAAELVPSLGGNNYASTLVTGHQRDALSDAADCHLNRIRRADDM
jgi:hypothetical protein